MVISVSSEHFSYFSSCLSQRWEKIRIFSLSKTALLKFSSITNCISAYGNCVSKHRNTWWSASFLSPYSHNHSPFPNQPGTEQGDLGSLWWKGRTLPLLPNFLDKMRLSVPSTGFISSDRQSIWVQPEDPRSCPVPVRVSEAHKWLSTDNINLYPGIQRAPCSTVKLCPRA